MSSFVLQLLIISAFGLMVQAAPVNNVSKKSTDTTMSNKEKNNKKLENNLYCVAQSLYNARGQLQNAGFTLPSIPQVDINNNTKIECSITSLIYGSTLPCHDFEASVTRSYI